MEYNVLIFSLGNLVIFKIDGKPKASSSGLAMWEQQQSIRACVDLLTYVVSTLDAVFAAKHTILPQMLFTSIEDPNNQNFKDICRLTWSACLKMSSY